MLLIMSQHRFTLSILISNFLSTFLWTQDSLVSGSGSSYYQATDGWDQSSISHHLMVLQGELYDQFDAEGGTPVHLDDGSILAACDYARGNEERQATSVHVYIVEALTIIKYGYEL